MQTQHEGQRFPLFFVFFTLLITGICSIAPYCDRSVLTVLSVLLNTNIHCLLFAENHILEDVNKCVIALQEKDVDGLDRTAGAIRGRAARVVHVVTSEMDNYEPGVYTEKVLEATKLLTDTGTRHVTTFFTNIYFCPLVVVLHLL